MEIEKKLPEAFIQRMKLKLGDEADDFFSALSRPPFLSVRVNPFKPTDKFNSYETVPWCPEGRYLTVRPSFIFDPLFHAGAYYVQEPSSMFLSEIFRQLTDKSQGLKVLDLCAAPGGKSTLILSEISSESLLVSNETIRSRMPALSENLMKWGLPNVMLTSLDPSSLTQLKNYFDVLVVDAPCSGEGLFRKDESSIGEWSEDNVQLCCSRQKRILTAVLDCLKKDGILIYSTCTFSDPENEENVNFISHSNAFESVRLNLKTEWNITETKTDEKCFSYRFYPHKVKGEGFFVSVFRKTSLSEGDFFGKTKLIPSLKPVSKKELLIVKPWLKNTDALELFQWNNFIYAVNKSQFENCNYLLSKIKAVSAGIQIGRIVNEELIPSHQLALSVIISEEVRSVELNHENALKYLRRQDLSLPGIDIKGWTLVKFEGHNLGWVKILQNRINNYLPKEYRILKLK